MTEYAQVRAKVQRLQDFRQAASPSHRRWKIWITVFCAEALAVFTRLDSVRPDFA